MNFYDTLKDFKKKFKLSNDDLGDLLKKTGDAVRKSLSRQSLSDLEIQAIKNFMRLKRIEAKEFKHHADSIFEEEEAIYNTNGNKYTPLKDGTFDIEAPMIPFTAYASYLESMEVGMIDQDFETTIFNVDRIGRGNYKAFIVRGDSMNGGRINDTPDKAKVLGRELGRHHWKDGFKPTDYGWIIMCKDNIYHKDIIDYDPETGRVICHSRNQSPEFSDFPIYLNDCYHVFKVIKRIF